MITRALRTLLAEPRDPDAPGPIWRDGVLVIAVLVGASIEAAVRNDLVWPVPSLMVAVVAATALPWRRRHALATVVATFGAVIATDLTSFAVGVTWDGINTMVVVLVLPYALFRWASGREASAGMAVMLMAATLGIVDDTGTIGETVAGSFILLFPAALGATVRYEYRLRERDIEQQKSEERAQLARELHDTVAHHVSAIAVQAQAGRAVADQRPEAAIDALAVIEEEASRTLAEMRGIVGALRHHGDPELAPQPGVGDIERLARAHADGPLVAVALTGELDDLRPAVGTALYRLAQESITNAVRHARRASRVDVRVAGTADGVRLTVVDDGEPRSATDRSVGGFGLVGMQERVTLLGGSFTAGPAEARGWRVEAALPREPRS